MPPSDPGQAGTPIGAVVLAAGMSRRMGQVKMLLPFGGRPMLGRVIECLQACGGISPITVVCGHAEQEIRAVTVEYTGVGCVHNPCYTEGGMLSSVKAGVMTLPESCGAFLLVLGDQPMIRPETLNRLRTEWHPASAPIVVPLYRGKRGHPVLISTRFAPEILALGENDTLKSLMLRHAEGVLEAPVEDAATVRDIDTPEDYDAALRWWREGDREP